MKQGYYNVTLMASNGASTSSTVFVKDNQIIGQGMSLSFYGSVYHETMILNVARNSFLGLSTILGEYQAYTFSGTIIETKDGYDLELDDHCDLIVNINFTSLSQSEGDECLTEFID